MLHLLIPWAPQTNNTQVNEAHDIDVVMLMYVVIEYIDNYSKTSIIL